MATDPASSRGAWMPEVFLCVACGGEVERDQSPGVWVHVDEDGGVDHGRDADHAPVPDLGAYGLATEPDPRAKR